MRRVSNRTLAVFLIIAIIISFVGTLASLNKLGKGVTGFGTIGEVNVTITQQAAFNLTFPSIHFGTGYVSPDSDNAYLSSEKGTSTGWTSTVGFSAGGIVIENVGNTDLNITFHLAENTSSFIGGTNSQFYYKSAENETNSCNGSVGGDIVSTPTPILAANDNRTICSNLSSRGTADALDFYVNLTIPQDASGTKGVVITFEGSLPE